MTEEKKIRLYKPKVLTQEDMDRNLKEAFKSGRKATQTGFKVESPFSQKAKEAKPWTPYRATPKQEKETDEQPYWSAEKWEDWAIKVYESFPEARKFLPSWVIEAIKDES